MSLLERLSTWLEAPYTELYRCANCGSRFEDADLACPECGGEIEPDETPELVVDYRGPM